MDQRDEVGLDGGNLTKVVRVGDTVRREAGTWTPMVHRLLRHLRDRGFTLSPDAIGIDDKGREILSFLPGQTLTGHPWPQWVWSDQLLDEAVRVLASYHRAVADFRPPLVESRLGARTLEVDQIVCHNDFAPYNCVFRDGHLVGVIDWDVVWAERPTWDLAFFAWHWVPLHAPSPDLAWRSLAACQRRLRHVVDSYGLEDRSDFIKQIISRIESSRNGILARAKQGDPVFVRLEQEGHANEMEGAIDFIRANEGLLLEELLK